MADCSTTRDLVDSTVDDDRIHSKGHEVNRVETEEQFGELAIAWKSLLASDSDAPIFLTWEWISTWWRHYGKKAELWLLTVRDNDSQRLVGIAPWMRKRVHLGPLRLRTVSFIGSGLVYPAHLDVIAADDEEEQVTTALLQFLREHAEDWDLLDLESVSADSLLANKLSLFSSWRNEESEVPCPFIPLPGSWKRYKEIALSSKFRKNLRYYPRRLERDHPGQVEYRQVIEPSQLTAAIDTIVHLHRKRWGAEGRSTAFNSKQFTAFHRDMVASALEQGWLRFYELAVDEHVIASKYCLRYENVFYWYQTAFDPDWGNYSPGRILLAHVIQEAIREGADEMDLLHGEGAHKSDWTDKVRVDSHLQVAGNFRGQLWLSMADFFQDAKEIGKRYTPEAMQRVAERYLFNRMYGETND